MARFIEVAKTSQIPEGGVLGVEAEGKQLVLVNAGGEIYALEDECPHEGAPLSDGLLEGEEIQCPWHSSRFNIKSGEVIQDPAEAGVPTYPVRVVGDAVEVEI